MTDNLNINAGLLLPEDMELAKSALEIALKEASETGYWLELLFRTGYIDEKRYKSLSDQCTSIRVLLVASCRTAKGENQGQMK